MVKVVLGDVRVERVLVVVAGIPGVLVMGEVECVSLLEVIMVVEKLLLGFTVTGRLVEPGTRGVVTKLVPIQVPLVGLCVLVKSVLTGMVPVLTGLGASVTSAGSVLKTEVEVSVSAGNTAVLVVELGQVALSVVEVKTDNGMVGVEVTSGFGPTSIHGVVGEADTIVTDIDSGHWVVGERVNMVVVWVRRLLPFWGEVVREVLAVSDEEKVGKAVTEDPVMSVL